MALMGAAVVILDARQVPHARRIARVLPGAAVHGPASLEDAADIAYERLRPIFPSSSAPARPSSASAPPASSSACSPPTSRTRKPSRR